MLSDKHQARYSRILLFVLAALLVVSITYANRDQLAPLFLAEPNLSDLQSEDVAATVEGEHQDSSAGYSDPAANIQGPQVAGLETRSWQEYGQALPDFGAVHLILDGRRANLRDDVQAIFTYFQDRPPDPFLLEQVESHLHERNYLRGAELRELQVTFGNFDTVPFPEDPDWSEDPLSERNWQSNLHNFVIMRYLMAAHARTGEHWYLLRAEELLVDWMGDNFSDEPPSEFSWNDRTTALRLENLLFLFEYVRAQEMSPEFMQMLLVAIYAHSNVLTDETFYKKFTNHGLDQSYILYWSGAVFPEFEYATLWREIGSARTQDEVSFAFTPEGVHVENSPTYHIAVFNRIVHIDQIFRHYSGESVNQEIGNLVNQVFRYTAYLVKPDGELPLIGDTYVQRPIVTRILGSMNELPAFQYFLYSTTQGEEGIAPSQPDAVFQESGHAIFRDNWQQETGFLQRVYSFFRPDFAEMRARSMFSQSVYLFFKASFHTMYHRQDDDLSFVLYGYDEDWIIDAGLYRYHEDDPLRQFVRSNRAHNLVLVDDLEFRRSPSDTGRSRIDTFELGQDFASVTGSHTLYPGFYVQRRIDYYKPDRIEIWDKAVPDDNQEHQYKILFHVPNDKEVTIEEEGVTIRSSESGKVLNIQPIQGEFHAIYTVSGQEYPTYQGWVSYTYGEISPAITIVFESEGHDLHTGIRLQFQ